MTPRTKTNSYFGYETRSPWAACAMLLGDSAFWRIPRRFQWADEVVISSVGGLGDLMIQLPLISALVSKCQQENRLVRIALRPEMAAIGRALGWEVLEWENPLGQAMSGGFSWKLLCQARQQMKGLKAQRIPLWIDLTGHVLSAMILKHAGVRRLASRISNGGRNWIDYALPHKPFRNEYETPGQLAAFFGVDLDTSVYQRLVESGRGHDDPGEGSQLAQPYICLAVTCMKWRKWPLSYFSRLIGSLPEHRFILLGKAAELMPEEQAILNELIRNRRVTNLLDQTTVLQAIHIIAEAKAIVTPDTSAAHIANAYGVPGIVIFGPQLAEVWTPPLTDDVSTGLHVLQDRSCPYFPCNYHVGCRRPDDWCMAKVRPEEVLQHLLKQINLASK